MDGLVFAGPRGPRMGKDGAPGRRMPACQRSRRDISIPDGGGDVNKSRYTPGAQNRAAPGGLKRSGLSLVNPYPKRRRNRTLRYFLHREHVFQKEHPRDGVADHEQGQAVAEDSGPGPRSRASACFPFRPIPCFLPLTKHDCPVRITGYHLNAGCGMDEKRYKVLLVSTGPREIEVIRVKGARELRLLLTRLHISPCPIIISHMS